MITTYNLPDIKSLMAGLTSILSSESAHSQMTVLHREPHNCASTFPSEMVTCQLDGGRCLRLLCKYSAGHHHNSHGHRGGVEYEAEVYRHLLQTSGSSVVTFYGTYADRATGWTWLVLEYLDDYLWVSRMPMPNALVQAARWAGQFHAAHESHRFTLKFRLNTYDEAYYVGWARRTSQFAGALHKRFPWLSSLCKCFEELAPVLLASPPTVIHGEFYPKNILVQQGNIYPVDWESAAIAAGEIDLAALTEDWSDETSAECAREYQKTRWRDGAPADFERTFDAARLYWGFRWLGDRPDWTTHEKSLRHFEKLRAAGERMGLI
jgi:hypothetical protein